MSNVNHPRHYNRGGPLDADGSAKYEAIKVIEDQGLGFKLGNALKYLLRAPDKGGREDYGKALWYLRRAVASPEARDHGAPCALRTVDVIEAWGLGGLRGDAVRCLLGGDLEEAASVAAELAVGAEDLQTEQ